MDISVVGDAWEYKIEGLRVLREEGIDDGMKKAVWLLVVGPGTVGGGWLVGGRVGEWVALARLALGGKQEEDGWMSRSARYLRSTVEIVGNRSYYTMEYSASYIL
jgi:hypothetical protein